MIEYPYIIPSNGLGTDFSQFERPITFAEVYTNRFRNVNGGAERRPGMERFSTAVSGAPNLTRIHEWTSNAGVDVLISTDSFGNGYVYNTATSAWDHTLSGKSSVKLLSAQVNDKLIFYNGVDRNFYSNDGGQTFNELKAIITTGIMAGGTNTTTLVDGDITNWIGNTLVANNDIVYNVTRNGYGIVSTVASAALTHTIIGTGGNGAGLTASNQTSGDVYQLIDYVDLNIIPLANNTKDNIATATTGTNSITIAVSGVNFANTEIRVGDIVYNTTRSAISLVSSVSANLGLTIAQQIALQVPGDALAFFKSAMPIASWIHVHYGRAYYLDARNKRNVVISAPDDPEDVTTFAKTLDATSFDFGAQQPTGDTIQTMGTFQGYFVAGGKRNMYIFRGNTPIQDASTTTIDFTPTAFYPNGVVSKFGLSTNGGDLLHVTNEGLQAINIGNISNTTVQNNVSNPIRNVLLTLIKSTSEDNIQLSFYPQRSWFILKIGSNIYLLNTNPSYNNLGQLEPITSWHLFTGKWAQQNHYFVRRDGTLLSCGANGLVYYMDNSAVTDDGDTIPTDLTTAWLRLEEPQRTLRVKDGQYIKPVFESGTGVSYTINAIAGWDNYSSDSISVTVQGDGAIGSAIVGTSPIGSGNFAQSVKHPLRWRGEEVRLQLTSNTSASPDVITGFTLYGNIGGVR